MFKVISKLFGLAGYKVVRGSELDKMQYQYKHKAQIKIDNNFNPLDVKKNLLKDIENPIVFDVGAYIGTTASEYAMIFQNGIIYAFEPTPNTFSQLQENCISIDNINSFNLAISDCDGEIEFFINEFAPTNSLLTPDEDADEYWGKGLVKLDKCVNVNTIRLDTFCSEKNILHIDLLKLDVQGAEIRVLKGASRLLDEGVIQMIYAEVIFVPTYENQTTYNEVGQYLSEKGYLLHSLYNLAYDGDRLKQADFLFIRG